jgi:two-component system response regulator
MRAKLRKGIPHSIKKSFDEILLVEDNENDAQLMIRGFQKFNLINKVHVINNGKDAIEFVLNAQHNLKIVILDLNLPNMDGFQVLQAIRSHKRTEHTPVVILTVDKDDASIEKGYKLGASSYIVKPVDFHKFAEVISALGFYWCFLNKTCKK